MKKLLIGVIIVFAAFLYITRDVERSVRDARPIVQEQFVSIVGEARKRSTGAHDVLRDSIHRTRNTAICSLLESMEVTDWTGEIEEIERKPGGRVEVKVRIGKSTFLVNRNTAIIFGDGARNLIEIGSPVYEQVLKFEKYQTVRVSGRFLEDREYCIKAVKQNLRNSLSMPEFVFRFSSIERL